MKIAFCLVGIVGYFEKYGVGKPIDPKIAYEYNKKNIFDVNDNVDVFMHSWSTDFKDDLVKIYEPKKYLIEEQIDFKQNDIRLNSIKSRWYSTKEVIRLKSEYEKENNFEYDFVMLYRFDSCFLKNLNFGELDNRYFYSPHSSKDNCEPYTVSDGSDCTCLGRESINDQWFFSNSKYMNEFSKLYDNWESYGIHNPHSECIFHIKKLGLGDKIRYIFIGEQDFDVVRNFVKDSKLEVKKDHLGNRL
tara:strand:+ start:29 stop:766 length:738 start_codon:yes stop_codon:yes gene_type:complete